MPFCSTRKGWLPCSVPTLTASDAVDMPCPEPPTYGSIKRTGKALDDYLKIYGRAVTGAAQRRAPRGALREEVLARQRSRCLYCDLPFGSVVMRRGEPVTLRINWDHFVPYAYAAGNPGDNWVAACHVCNGIKSARMFDTVMEAQQFIRARWAVMGYELGTDLLPAAPMDDGSCAGDDEQESRARRVLVERIRRLWKDRQPVHALQVTAPNRNFTRNHLRDVLDQMVRDGSVVQRPVGDEVVYVIPRRQRSTGQP
jgi:hypothetical protein